MDRPTRERRTSRRMFSIMATLGLMAGMVGAVASMAGAATITRDTITQPSTETGLTDDCLPGLTGTIVGTDVFSYQSVETAQGFHLVGTTTGTGLLTWSDGSTYGIVESVDHISYNAGKGTEVFTDAHQDSFSSYTADGVFLFGGTFHLVEHFTVTDGVVVRVEFERSHFRIFGDC